MALALVRTALAAAIWLTISAESPSPPAGASPPQGKPTSPGPRPTTATPTPKQRTPSDQDRPERRAPRGPVLPADAVGAPVGTLEDRLKSRGYDVHKVDLDSSAPKDAIVATIPAPGQPLRPGQTVVLVASKGEPPDHPSRYVIPTRIIGSDAHAAEQRLKEHGLDVQKVDGTSSHPEDLVLATYPAPGTTARAGTVVLAISTKR